jgi:hypothetical protein
MKTWSFYSLETGQFIDSLFYGNPGALEINTPDGTGAIEGRFDRMSQAVQVVDGVATVIAYTPPVDQLRPGKWYEIKAARDTAVAAAGSSVEPVLGAVLDTSSGDDRANITSVAVLLMANPGQATVRFTCADNVRREFARADFINAASLIGEAVQSAFDTADTLRQQIDVAADTDALTAIAWPTP